MDRQAHDFAAAMAFAQQQQAANVPQQQQFGFHPQQFPPSAHGPPFMPPQHSQPQYPYHHLQVHPHHPSHAHLIHQQQPPPAYLPHVPPNFVTPPFHGPYDSAPPAPPTDPELQKRIDTLVEYVIKNGPGFEAMVREKEQDNPACSFIFGGEGHNYYRYKLWLATRPPSGPFNPQFPPSSMPMVHPPNPMITPPLNAPQLNASAVGAGPSASVMSAPQMHKTPFAPFHDQQHHQPPQPFVGHGRPDYDQPSYGFKGLAGPLPSDVAVELNNVLNSLTGTKESIKGAKIWFMQRSPFAPALSEALRDRMFSIDDAERQLHIIYLANDILFDSLQRRVSPLDLDNEALAFKPVLGSMLSRIYHNPKKRDENQSRLQKILQFWASKEVYDPDTIRGFENEMINGPQKELPVISSDPSAVGGWKHGDQSAMPNIADRQISPPIPHLAANQQFLHNSVPSGGFVGSIGIPSSAQLANQQAAPVLPASNASIGEKLPPYPLFPPGLIPGMVRKMQIGSGVPYSPMSPLDIPTVIPPSNVPPSEIHERVSKFFREIGEVNPSEGPMKPSESRDEDDEYEREAHVRKGGACIPPPPNLQVDPETGTYADGSVERKPGLSGSAHLGLGATANPNEVSQYDDVYTSYRKQRSTTYHSSMSARAASR